MTLATRCLALCHAAASPRHAQRRRAAAAAERRRSSPPFDSAAATFAPQPRRYVDRRQRMPRAAVIPPRYAVNISRRDALARYSRKPRGRLRCAAAGAAAARRLPPPMPLRRAAPSKPCQPRYAMAGDAPPPRRPAPFDATVPDLRRTTPRARQRVFRSCRHAPPAAIYADEIMSPAATSRRCRQRSPDAAFARAAATRVRRYRLRVRRPGAAAMLLPRYGAARRDMRARAAPVHGELMSFRRRFVRAISPARFVDSCRADGAIARCRSHPLMSPMPPSPPPVPRRYADAARWFARALPLLMLMSAADIARKRFTPCWFFDDSAI